MPNNPLEDLKSALRFALDRCEEAQRCCTFDGRELTMAEVASAIATIVQSGKTEGKFLKEWLNDLEVEIVRALVRHGARSKQLSGYLGKPKQHIGSYLRRHGGIRIREIQGR